MNNKINNHPVLIAAILTILLLAGVASAVPTKQIIKSEYPAFLAQFGIGEVLYKVTDDYGVSYQVERNSLNLKLLSITSRVPATIKIEPGGTAKWTVTINGCCKGLDGGAEHSHYLKLFNDDTGAEMGTYKYSVYDGGSEYAEIIIGTFNTRGTYKYRIKEFIDLWNGAGYTRASGNTIYVTVQVGAVVVPTPIPTTPTPTKVPTPIPTTPTPTHPPPVVTTYPPEPTATGTAKVTPISTYVEKEIQCPPGTYLNDEICVQAQDKNLLYGIGGLLLLLAIIFIYRGKKGE